MINARQQFSTLEGATWMATAAVTVVAMPSLTHALRRKYIRTGTFSLACEAVSSDLTWHTRCPRDGTPPSEG